MLTGTQAVVRLVLDTNTALSGLLWQGPPGRILDLAQTGEVVLFASVPMLDELQGVIQRSKFTRLIESRGLNDADLFEGYASLCSLVTPAAISPVVHADPDDDMVLATALAARADAIVTRDNAMLNVKHYHGINILNSAGALRLFDASRRRRQ